ncbi:MAG: NERD domain-containing protein [Chloroflexota bacterium]
MTPQTEPKKDSKQVVVELTVTLEEARQMIWLGRGPREPMGKLWDSKVLDRVDFAWASERFDDNPRFKEAVRTLLAHSIGQPLPIRHGPKVIEGSHYLEETERDIYFDYASTVGAGVGIGISVLILIILSIPYIFLQLLSGNLALAAILVLIIVIAVGWGTWYIYSQTRRHLESYRNFRSGREGEETVAEKIRCAIDNRWTIFRNLHLPGHKDDLDIVLVGPGGVWAVEVKSTKSTLRVEGKNWEIQTRRGWMATGINPSNEVTQRAMQLNNYLQKQGIDRFVERAVALSVPQPPKNFGNSEIPIWLPATIENQVSNLKTRFSPGEDETKRIVGLLNGLAERQIAAEEAKYK